MTAVTAAARSDWEQRKRKYGRGANEGNGKRRKAPASLPRFSSLCSEGFLAPWFAIRAECCEGLCFV